MPENKIGLSDNIPESPISDMSLEERILTALRSGPMTAAEVGQAVGLDAFRTKAWLSTLLDDGLVDRLSDGRYLIGSPEAA